MNWERSVSFGTVRVTSQSSKVDQAEKWLFISLSVDQSHVMGKGN